MRIFLLIFFFTLTFSCKRHRKVNVIGTVTDKYTGQFIPNLKVRLISTIGTDKYGEYKEYFTHTDANGKYNFDNAYFSDPSFSGFVQIYDDENRNYVTTLGDGIDKREVKLLGKTTLIKNLETYCISKLNLGVNISSTYNWRTLKVSQKFNGSTSIGQEDFSGGGYYTIDGPNTLPTCLTGYSDGKTIFKSELFDISDNLLKTQYDTIISLGCGTENSYILNIN